MIDKILVAVERRGNNSLVSESAISLAKTTGASLMLLHVLSEEANYPLLPTYAYYPIFDDSNYEIYQKQLTEYKQLGIDFLQKLKDRAKLAGVKAEYSQIVGNRGRTICQLASTWNADLIIVGSRGLKGFQEMFLGSVSNYVTHHAPCSVLIVRESMEHIADSNSIALEKESLSKNRF